MPLVPTKMADAQCSVSGNHWPGGPRDMLTTMSAHVNSSLASWATYKTRIFYKYVVFKHLLSLWPNFFVAATLSLWPIFFAAATFSLTKILHSSNTMPRRHSYTRTMRRFPISEKLPVQTIEKGHFKFAILFVA